MFLVLFIVMLVFMIVICVYVFNILVSISAFGQATCDELWFIMWLSPVFSWWLSGNKHILVNLSKFVNISPFCITENFAFLKPFFYSKVCIYIYIYIQWGKKVFSQPPIVQVLPLKKMREACNFHHRYTSTMRDKIRKKNPENHIVRFLKILFANYGGK